MSNQPQQQQQNQNHPTAEQVEQQRRQAEQQEQQNKNKEGGQSISVDNQQVSLQNQQQRNESNQQGRTDQKAEGTGTNANVSQPTGQGEGKVSKLTFQSQFVKIEISDPNILDELNTEGKYPNIINFDRLEVNVNKMGGRISITTDDKRGISKEILSGINPKETNEIKEWKVN